MEGADVVEHRAHLVVDVGVVADDPQVDVVPRKIEVAVPNLLVNVLRSYREI